MTIEEGLQLLKSYVEVKKEKLDKKDDANFKEFSEFIKSLNTFAEKYKSTCNINNVEEFCNLIFQELEKQKQNNVFEPKQELYAVASLALVKEITNNGFIDFEKFHNDFSENLNKFKSKTQDVLQEQNHQEQLQQDEILQNEAKAKEEQIIEEELKIQREKGLEETNLDTSDLEAEALGQINEVSASLAQSCYLTQNNMDIREEIGKLEKLQNTDDFAMPTENRDTTKKDFAGAEINSEQRVSPGEMLNFINDSTQIQFPFSAQKTINDKKFLTEFHKELKGKSTQELQKLIDNMRAKNDALRQEIAELNDKKRKLLETLKNEVNISNKLTAVHNQEFKDSERDFQKTSKDFTKDPHNPNEPKPEDLQRNKFRKRKP